MHELYELKEKLLNELKQYGQQEMSAGTLQVVDTLSHAVKNICKIIEMSEEEGYSERGNYSREGYSRNRNSYDGQGGYSRGRNSRRDSMGRYSRTGGYSRTDGMAGIVEDLQNVMQELPQGLQQDAQRFIQKLEQEM